VEQGGCADGVAHVRNLLVNAEAVAMVQLLAQLMSEPAFDELRTKQQLGYIVYARARAVGAATGIQVVVQSTQAPTVVWPRVRAFVDGFAATMRGLPDSIVRSTADALVVQLGAKYLKLRALADRVWGEVATGRPHDFREQEIQALGG
jgi:secreted Zn-dependent insulinase-like peptidase